MYDVRMLVVLNFYYELENFVFFFIGVEMCFYGDFVYLLRVYL